MYILHWCVLAIFAVCIWAQQAILVACVCVCVCAWACLDTPSPDSHSVGRFHFHMVQVCRVEIVNWKGQMDKMVRYKWSSTPIQRKMDSPTKELFSFYSLLVKAAQSLLNWCIMEVKYVQFTDITSAISGRSHLKTEHRLNTCNNTQFAPKSLFYHVNTEQNNVIFIFMSKSKQLKCIPDSL